MSDNVQNRKIGVVEPQVNRFRASGPILFLAILFVVGAFLTWYFTWFGRQLNHTDIATYLADSKHPRKVQHALLQIQERLERQDPSARQWHPQVVALASSGETEVRLTVAWLMGFDNKSSEFQESLLKLLRDPEPVVRRNAALALVRHNDAQGRQELLSILTPYVVSLSSEGVLTSSVKPGDTVARGSLLARIREANDELVALRSPLRGTVDSVAIEAGARVSSGQPLLSLKSDEESVWEALRGLALIGEPEDAAVIERYLEQSTSIPDRTKEQAALTVKAIESRKK